MSGTGFTIVFDPMVAWPVLAVAAAIGVLLAGIGMRRRAGGAAFRLGVTAALIATLANPTLVLEQRETRPDVAVILLDESPSQAIADRPEIRAEALAHVTEALAGMRDLDVRIVRVHGERPSASSQSVRPGTRLFDDLDRALGDVPKRRLAGIIAITDGRVHDAEAAFDGEPVPAPFHVILTGARAESDRRLTIEQAPAFGMVGSEATLMVRVEDPDGAGTVPLTIRIDGEQTLIRQIPVNQTAPVTVTLRHAGETIVELEVPERAGELSAVNNRAIHTINGVRERLRVLLISGAPHPGERTWRDLLKADPSVDLVHFTILRPPEKQDGTPIRELSLIAFPVRELFELKINDFDLIVFDRYRRQGVLPRAYFDNITEYVRNGGALLAASGPTFATRQSLARSAIGAVLPGAPTGQMVERGFRPRITDEGFRHPVTADLAGGGRVDATGKRIRDASWGRWLRQIDATPVRGSILLDGAEARPLLMLDRVGEGRVAHLLSDHVWLWSRGFEGGGPQSEMLRRTAHWLMKEPDLEENDLRATVTGDRLQVTRRTTGTRLEPVTLTRPDGTVETRPLSESGPGRGVATFRTDQIGLHMLGDGELKKLIAVGVLNPVEFDDLSATEAILRPLADQSGGGTFWARGSELGGELGDGLPDVRRVRGARVASGRGWIGMRANRDYVVTGVRLTSLLPGLLVLILVLSLALVAWRREAA